MSGFDALGRDVAAAADSEGDAAVATALKTLWVWAGFDAGTNPNHLWQVEYEKTEDGFTVSAVVKDRDVWAPEPVVSPPASAAELAASAATAEVVEEPVSDAAPEAALEPVEVVPEVAPADPPVAASSNPNFDTSSDSTTDAAASQ